MESVGVYVGGLDRTTGRAVSVFLERPTMHRFGLVDRDTARILLVDVDQPGATDRLGEVRADQLLVGVGFDPAPSIACAGYIQKPLTGTSLMETLESLGPVEDVPAVEVPPAVSERDEVIRSSRRLSGLRATIRGDVEPGPRPKADAAVRTGAPRSPTSRAHHRPTRTRDRDDHGIETVAGPAATAERMTDVRAVQIPMLPEGDLHDPEVLASSRFNADDHVCGRVRRAVEQGRGRYWELTNERIMIAAGGTPDELQVSAGDSMLRLASAKPLSSDWVFRTPSRPRRAGRNRTVARESLLWDTTVWSAEGRLCDTIDPDDVVAVRAWPDFTRCIETPSAMAIVALLAGSPRRVDGIAETLGIPRSHVFVALSALCTSGLLDIRRADGTDTVPAPPPPATPQDRPARGLLRRFLSRLRT